MDTKLLGGWGETLAKNFLTKKKYSVIGMNYRTRFGEIDLIASDKKYVVFAEVKLRKSSMFAAAREFVDAKKQERIRKTAYIWLADNKTELQPRFDVIEIYAPYGMDTAKPEINHIENAF